MKTCGGSEGIAPPFMISVLDVEVSGQLHALATLPLEKEPQVLIHWIGSWVDPKAGLNAVEQRKIPCTCRVWNPGRPARSLSLYRLAIPAPRVSHSS
jgi:hypothetical protein